MIACVCTYACVCPCMCVCMSVCMHVCDACMRVHVCGYIRTLMLACVHAWVCVCMCTCVCECMYICTCSHGFIPVYNLPLGQVLEEAIRPDTSLVSVMMVNNEIGVTQPIKEIGS